MLSKSFDHDHDQNFLNNRGQKVKILTVTMTEIQIFKPQFEIKATDLLSNTMSADRALSEKSFNDAGDKVNKDKWYMSPATVNAYYNPKVV